MSNLLYNPTDNRVYLVDSQTKINPLPLGLPITMNASNKPGKIIYFDKDTQKYLVDLVVGKVGVDKLTDEEAKPLLQSLSMPITDFRFNPELVKINLRNNAVTFSVKPSIEPSIEGGKTRSKRSKRNKRSKKTGTRRRK
jgi:hypothetical protein